MTAVRCSFLTSSCASGLVLQEGLQIHGTFDDMIGQARKCRDLDPEGIVRRAILDGVQEREGTSITHCSDMDVHESLEILFET